MLHRMIAAIVAAILLFAAFPADSHDWSKVAAKVERSTVPVSYPKAPDYSGHPACTAFQIHQQKGYLMTAYHCLGTTMFVDKKIAQVLWMDKVLDLAVLEANVHQSSLEPSTDSLRKGQPVAVVGYGYGMKEPIFTAGYIAHTGIAVFSHPGLEGLWFVFDSAYIGGMSGSAVFDTHGKVVSIVQLSDNLSGFGRNINTIMKHTGKYWEYADVQLQ